MTHRIERLRRHDRSQFECGVPELTGYLRRQAGQDERKRVASCFVAAETETDRVVGFYTLSAAAIDRETLPEAITRRLPKYDELPVIRLGRLAVDESARGQGLGAALLADAFARAKAMPIGAVGLFVDAKDSAARDFYSYHGFEVVRDGPIALLRRF